MTGGATVGIQGEEQRGKDAALGGTGAHGPGVRHVSPATHAASCQTGSQACSAGRACPVAEPG